MSVTDTVVVSDDHSHVDWRSILAGAVLASAIGVVLLTFGAAIGLSVTSPYEGEGWSPMAFAIAAGLWLLWVQIFSFYCAGYVAARLRARSVGLSEHEVDVRDGLHGALVWAAGVLIAGFIATIGVGGLTTAARTADARSDLASSVTQVVSGEIAQGAAAERADSPEAAAATPDQRRAEIARKLTIISAFITAASLLAGGVAAFFGSSAGGQHRDGRTHVELFAIRRGVRATTPR